MNKTEIERMKKEIELCLDIIDAINQLNLVYKKCIKEYQQEDEMKSIIFDRIIDSFITKAKDCSHDVEWYQKEIESLKVNNEELKRQIKYVYTEEEINKKNEINHLVRKNFNGNIIGAYVNLYKLFEDTYGINLKEECNKYNEDKEKRLKVNIIQYCLMTGHITQLYECCKMLYN